jgi:hypothetical protein
MKRLCLFLLVALIAFPALAQPEKGYVYLKNGTILKGKYQYSNDFEKLKIESAGNLWIFEADEVDSISGFRAHSQNLFDEENKDVKYFFRTEIGVLAGNSDNSQTAPFCFSTSLNYKINSNLSAGAGIGFEFLKETYLPAFINVEYKFRNSLATPYFFIKGGYQISIEESQMIYYGVYPVWSSSIWPGPDYYNQDLDTKGGFLINPGIGYQRMFSPGFGMSFAFGYQFHRLHYDGENDYRLDIDYNRLTIKLGIIFY